MCILVAFAGLALLCASLASQWSTMQSTCFPISSCSQNQLDPASAQVLNQHGITLGTYAALTAGVLAVTSIIWYGLATLIMWRKRDDRGALVAAFFLVLFPQFALGFFTGGPELIVGFAALILFGLLFPNSRFVPKWSRWVAAADVLSLAALEKVPAVGQSGVFWVVPIFLIPLATVGVQIYRFRTASSWAERQQTKWAFLGLLAGMLGLLAIFLASIFVPGGSHSPGMDAGGLFGAFVTWGVAIVTLVIPISITIAMLRSRLWEVDRVISRTLLYAALTVTLAGIYIGSVIGLQSLFRLTSGSSSSLAIAISTLVIAALFGPIRRHTQITIDRRFYRSKYDAAQTLATFGERLRSEIDMATLSRDLTLVVHESLSPEHVSLWLREG